MNNPIVVAFDLESTGMLRDGSPRWQDQPGITQIGASRLVYRDGLLDAGDHGWRIESTYTTYIDPELPPERWEPGAIEKTGIGPDTVKDAPNLLMAHAELAEFFRGATHAITFNGEWFDYTLLNYQLQRYGLDKLFPWPPCHIDLMKQAATWAGIQGKRGEKKPTLEELYEIVVGHKFDNAHDAGADIEATVQIFIKKGGLHGLGYL